jgi:hypothetical protein
MKALRLLILGLLAVVSGVAGAQGSSGLRGIAVSPVMFRTLARPGQSLKLQVDLENLEPAPVLARLRAHAVTYADWGYAPVLDKAGPRDCSKWIGNRDLQQSISANSLASLTLNITVPRRALLVPCHVGSELPQ